MFLWVEVPDKLSTYKYLPEILEEYHIAYSPGAWFQPVQIDVSDLARAKGYDKQLILGEQPRDNLMRLCVVTEEPEVVEDTINKLAQALTSIAQRDGIPLFNLN